MQPSHQKPSDDSQFHVLAAHSANLQRKLFATLDALTELQRCHQSELDEFRTQADRWRANSRALKRRAKAAEAERDRERQGVDELVEKVEIADGRPVLSPGRMHLAYPLEPMPIPLPSPHAGPSSQRDPYYSSVVNYLAAELTAKKQACAELKKTSEARIAILEDQVARRDIELQELILHPCTCHAPQDTRVPPHAHPPRESHRTVFTKERIREVQDQTAMKNRALDIEVRELSRKLEEAKSSSQRRLPIRPKSNFTSEQVPAPKSAPVSPHPPDSLHQARADLPQGSASERVLSDIEQQIAGLGQDIDRLETERHNLADTLTTDPAQPINPTNAHEEFQGILLIEEECIRLRRSERALRQELLLSGAAASATEQELQDLVKRLQRQVDELRYPNVSDTSLMPGTDTSLILGEQDMDLEDDAPATESLDPTDQTIRPLAPPTPPTPPSSLPSWAWSARAPSPLPARPPTAPPFRAGPAAERLARIERELAQAREDVAHKDRAIAALRTQFGDLEAQWHGDGDG